MNSPKTPKTRRLIKECGYRRGYANGFLAAVFAVGDNWHLGKNELCRILREHRSGKLERWMHDNCGIEQNPPEIEWDE